MPFNPSSFDPQNTFHIDPQASHIDPQAGGVFTPADERDPLDAVRPDIAIQIRDGRMGKPPCFDPVDLENFKANIAKALMSDFPDAYIDSACVGATPDQQATAFGVWLTPPADAEEQQRNHRGLRELGGRTPGQTISFFLNARLFTFLAASAWNSPDMHKRLDSNGIPQLDGSIHLTDLKLSMRPPDTLVTTVTGFDESPWPDADFTITIAETYHTEAGKLFCTPVQTFDVDTGLSTVVAAALAMAVFASGWFALPFMYAVFRTVGMHQAEEHGVPALKGAGSTITDHFLLPAIPIPGGKKLPIDYLNQVTVTKYGLFAGGFLQAEVPRTPAITLVGPSSIQSAMGQGIVRGHYRAEVEDLLGPVAYAWTSDGEVIGEGGKVTVHFDTPPSGGSHVRHIGITVTDNDGLVVSETREVSISTLSQGPDGHGPGSQGGGSGSNNPRQDP